MLKTDGSYEKYITPGTLAKGIIIRNNYIFSTGNRYICFWRIPVRGLLVEGNRSRIKPNWHSVFVNAQVRFSVNNLVVLPCEKVIIRNNTTEGGGIKVIGAIADNEILNNRHTLIEEAYIECKSTTRLSANLNYEIRIISEEE